MGKAPRQIKGKMRVGGQDHMYLECHIAFAIPGEDDDVIVHPSTQHPSEAQHMVAHVLDVPSNAVTINVRSMGGGFGGKETQMNLFCSVAAVAAKKWNRAVKIRPDRDDDMSATGKRHDFVIDYEVGFDDDGVINAVTGEFAARCGFSSDLSGPVTDRALFHADNAYYYPNVLLNSHPMKTNTVSNTAFRGFGGPQGVIVAPGNYQDVAAGSGDATLIDHRPHLLMAGFIDAHIHFPQVQIVASWGNQLLDWLNDYTFPAEAEYANAQHARAMAGRFCNLLTDHGTMTAGAFCSVHAASAEALFAEAADRNIRMIAGKTMMDRNAPDTVLDTPQSSFDVSKALIEQWHGKGCASYAITPRFAITSTPEQLEMARALASEHPDCYIQTHLSENHDEIAFTAELYPDARDYLDVYEGYGLLGPRTLLGHAIHLKDREIGAIADTGAHPVFCPTSNLFLGSGLFDDAGLRARGIQSGIATDIGAGTSYSMLQTLNEGCKILQLQDQKLHTLRAFYWITCGNAEVLGMADKIGTLDAGTEADIVVVNARVTPAMEVRMDRADSLSEELFVIQMMGDDRAIAQTYVAGIPQKQAPTRFQ